VLRSGRHHPQGVLVTATLPGNCRVDMYLDCCHSGQFVASFIGKILNTCKGLVPGRFWCSSMPFQESFECPALKQGVFTHSFLSDYSTKKRSFFSSLFRRRNPSLQYGDVGRRTRSRQNPFLIDSPPTMVHYSLFRGHSGPGRSWNLFQSPTMFMMAGKHSPAG